MLLNFKWMERSVDFNEKIDLTILFITVKIQWGIQYSCIAITLDDFSNHKGLEKGSSLSSVSENLGCVPAGQIGGQAGIKEIELRCFYNPFQQVVVIGLQQINDVRGHQDGQPAFCSGLADADIAGQLSKVEQLAGSGRCSDYEAGEFYLVTYLGQFTHIAIDIGPHI